MYPSMTELKSQMIDAFIENDIEPTTDTIIAYLRGAGAAVVSVGEVNVPGRQAFLIMLNLEIFALQERDQLIKSVV